ncbi:hypothetical protein [uncultured Corynebacterium sp.]|uniref:hypothetical protein n=1 Tax=uncultured Corynebacterium sp. TaxID=159447 RepID=UPI00260F96FC|nr:hypothetical protein [uncultured Corynebacterium sp.]
MRKTLLAATAASALTLGLVTPASAMNWDDNYTPLTVGSSDENVNYKFAWDEEKPWELEATVVEDKKGKPLCDSENPAVNDFMWTSGNGRCTYKTPLQVIKDITAYITAISSAISAVIGIANTATKFAN